MDSESHLIRRFFETIGFMRLQPFWRHAVAWLCVNTFMASLNVFNRFWLSGLGSTTKDVLIDFLLGGVAVAIGQMVLWTAARKESDLRQRAETDPLTGLLNRKAFEARLQQGNDGYLMLLDADHFKSINDQLGHAAGDEALIAMAQHLTYVAGTEAAVARWGGEEFAVLLPSDSKVIEIAGHICSGVVLDRYPGNRQVTCSVAVRRLQPADRYNDVVRQVDSILMQAKSGGRAKALNSSGTCIAVADQSLSVPVSELLPTAAAPKPLLERMADSVVSQLDLIAPRSPLGHAITFASITATIYCLEMAFRSAGNASVNYLQEFVQSLVTDSFLIALIMMAVSQVVSIQAALIHQADHDGLTGLVNRRKFFRVLRDAQDSGGLLLVLDADYFKRVNDQLGHDMGDECLLRITQLLRDHAPDDSTIGRLGGEEFGIFVPSADARMAQKIAEPICQGVTLNSTPPMQVTLSIGATLLSPGEDISDSLNRGDRALYSAKSSGRERLEMAPEWVAA